MNSNQKLTQVYTAMSEMEARVIKSLLDSYDIPCLFQSNAAPSVHPFTIDGMGEVKIMVPQSMTEKAKEIIEDRNDA